MLNKNYFQGNIQEIVKKLGSRNEEIKKEVTEDVMKIINNVKKMEIKH